MITGLIIFGGLGFLILTPFVRGFMGGLTGQPDLTEQTFASSNVDSDDEIEPFDFYINSVEAASHGALFKLSGDRDDGPGFYM